MNANRPDILLMADTIKMDGKGRVLISAGIHRKYRTRQFFLENDGNRIQLIPIRSMTPLFGTIPEPDLLRICSGHEEEEDEE